MQPSFRTPGILYNANLAFCLRVNELMQIGRMQWVESGTRLFNEAVADYAADFAQPGIQESGAPTKAFSGEVFLSRAKRRSGHIQEASRLALEQQRTLSTSLREAAATWGTAVTGSLGAEAGALPVADAWLGEMTKWTQAWPVVAEAK